MNRTEPDRDSKFLHELLPRLAVVVHIVVCDNLLVKFEEVDPVVGEHLLLCHFLNKVLVCGSHFRTVDRSCLWSLVVDTDKLGLGLGLDLGSLSLESVLVLGAAQWPLLLS